MWIKLFVCLFFSPWGHVNFMPKYGHCDVTKVTWAKYSMLIGRDKICCALIGYHLQEPPLLLALKAGAAFLRLLINGN